MNFEEEIKRRRTFAIISHPDAGKTTLTEKLLLFGGAIHEAGAVKSNKIKKAATSDFMEIEKQRGISVATSVMAFEYNDIKINILDTPGHQDFAEDTYRTLTAADSVIVVVDVAKGVETQTEKLVSVCRMRKIPIIVFINKLDREGLDAFDLLDEIEKKLGITVRPLSWPIGMGWSFKGVYDLYWKRLMIFSGKNSQVLGESFQLTDLSDNSFDECLGNKPANRLREELELLKNVYPDFSVEEYLNGSVSPVFFGSALNNFGVKELLECFIEIAPCPTSKAAEERLVFPYEDKFTGFIFKIHANMDPNHRNRLAFIKICSGIFERNKNYLHVRKERFFRFSSPTTFLADKKSIIEESYPGDIIGVHDSGNFKIGDTLTEGEDLHFTGIPSFSPEFFRYIENADPLKSKQLSKGIDQLMDEGVAQLFILQMVNRKIIGTVGPLQFDVIEFRLKHEYNATCRYEMINIYKACWITSNDKKALSEFKKYKYNWMAWDKQNRDVFLAESSYALRMAQDKYPEIQFHYTSEF
jgi:peptide chain release factor 3